jgi:peroxiredoxin
MKLVALATILAVSLLAGILSLAAKPEGVARKQSAKGGAPGVGDRAPDFEAPYATAEKVVWDRPWRLSEEIGEKAVVLAFYPADFSPGCTKEMCTFRDNFQALVGLNAKVVGISGDYVWAHHAWAKSENLPFPLLSDHSHHIARLYGSYDEKSGYNKRTVFVIDGKGIIRYVDLEYSVADEKDYEMLKAAIKRVSGK